MDTIRPPESNCFKHPSDSTSSSAFDDTPQNSQFLSSRPSTRCFATRSGRPQTATGATRDGSDFIVAVIEGRGVASEVGMCFLNLRTSECLLSQIADSQTYVKTLHKLHLYNPSEVLVSITAVEPQKSKLCKIIEDNFPSACMTPIGRKYFNDAIGCFTPFTNNQYVEGIQNIVFINNSIKFKYQGVEVSVLFLDCVTARNLELITNITNPKSSHSLYGKLTIASLVFIYLMDDYNDSNHFSGVLTGTLNQTLTPMGVGTYLIYQTFIQKLKTPARLLRTNILQPLTDQVTINTRLNSVEELTQNEARSLLRCTIRRLIKVPRRSSVQLSEQNINHTILLKYTLKSIEPLVVALGSCQSALLVAIRKVGYNLHLSARNYSSLTTVSVRYPLIGHIWILKHSLILLRYSSPSNLGWVERRIHEVINEDAKFQKSALGLRNQRCYAVKAGVNGLLDVARQTYKETIDDIYELVGRYVVAPSSVAIFVLPKLVSFVDSTGIQIKLQFNSTSGFYLSASTEQLNDQGELPLMFINIVRKRETGSAIQKNNKINESLTEVYLMSDKTIAELIADVRYTISIFYKASESIGMLDMLVSFAHMCTIANYTRPEFTETLAIKAGRHPMRERIHLETFVPNDTYASDTASFQFITGPNMSGKSTYLRQIALLSVMAQIGSFVPAEYASFRIVSQLFSRICNDDNLETNASAFMVEMRETAYIVQNVTDDSLVIIDELGRGTSTQDALGITYAVCEQLLKSKAFIFFATHFHELSTRLVFYPNVVSLHFQVQIDNEKQYSKIRYLYTVKDGSTTEEHYGLKLADMAGFPQDIVNRAAAVSHQLEALVIENRQQSKSTKATLRRKSLVTLARQLREVRNTMTNISETYLCEYLKLLQDEFLETMQKLK
ncbi:muts domain V-domain-containing protein [Endogone sp. FLAS-F59071]|nr:muts domain V-domain-containing protein [Endogone sp. FLAS-F59071]|eukprot:RUS17438.1 muts domain V-domain-containing protein [Endogone sp. FLAS-F59071]